MCSGLLLLPCLAFLVSSSTACSESQQQVRYITKATTIPCPGQPCLTLDEYIACSNTYITSNTVFRFLPGQHNVTRSFVARDIECITFEGNTRTKSDPQVKISAASSSSLQFINATDVYIAGIELCHIAISLQDTENVTLHQVVFDGPSTAISLRNTVDTNISCCIVKNTGWTGAYLQNTIHTSISNTTINNTGWNGLKLYNTSHTKILYTCVNRTGWSGIEIDRADGTIIYYSKVNNTRWVGIEVSNSNGTLIAHTTVNNTRWIGIEVYKTIQITVIDTIINNTGWDGVEFSYTEQTAIVQCTVENTRWNGMEFDNADRTYIYDITVINPGWYGFDFCNMRLTSIVRTRVLGTRTSRCIRQCSPRDPTLQVECTG